MKEDYGSFAAGRARRCVIIGAAPEAHWDNRWPPDLVVCADGGCHHALRLGLIPGTIIGDGDSGGSATLPAEKDMTDMEACLVHALQSGADEIALLGATGGRLDHFLGNIGLLERAGGKAFMLDAGHEIRAIGNRPYTIGPPHRCRYFSVIPLDEAVKGVTITGAKYPLQDADLYRNATVGVSNEPLEGQPFTVTVKSGRALLVLSEKL
jgi:thiamine pyrophosphokinase